MNAFERAIRKARIELLNKRGTLSPKVLAARMSALSEILRAFLVKP